MNDEWSGNAVKQTIKDHETEKVKDSKWRLFKSTIESLAKSPAVVLSSFISTIATIAVVASRLLPLAVVFVGIPLGLLGCGALLVGISAVGTAYTIWKHSEKELKDVATDLSKISMLVSMAIEVTLSIPLIIAIKI